MARVRGGRRAVRGRRRDRRRACAPRPTRSSSRRPTDHGRLAEFGLAVLPEPGRPAAPDPDPLQHRAARLRPVRDGARRRPGRAPRRSAPIHVWVDETRPYLQGARLTAWELAQAGVPHTLIPDVAAGHLMAARRGRRRPRRRRPDRGQRRHREQGRDVHAGRAGRPPRHPVLSSARRLARSTSRRPTARPSRSRSAAPDEVLVIRGVRIAPPGTEVRNPAFDVTPAELITGIVTEEGVLRAPFEDGAARAADRRGALGATPGVRARAASRADGIARGRRRAGRRRAGRRPADGHASRSAGARAVVARATTDRRDAARLPRARPAVRGVRHLRPRGARVRADPLGRSPATATTLDRARPRVHGPTPQPLFVMGRDRRHRGDPARRHPAAGRVRRRAARRCCRPSRRTTASTPGRRWSGCGSTGPRFRPYPATVQRLLPGRDRRAQPAVPARVRVVAAVAAPSPTASTTGCASTASSWPRRAPTSSARGARLAVVGNVLTQLDYRGRGFATAVTGAVTAELLRTCDQVVLNVRSDNPPALNAYRRLGLRRARPLRGAPRPPPRLAVARPRGAAAPPLRPARRPTAR